MSSMTPITRTGAVFIIVFNGLFIESTSFLFVDVWCSFLLSFEFVRDGTSFLFVDVWCSFLLSFWVRE